MKSQFTGATKAVILTVTILVPLILLRAYSQGDFAGLRYWVAFASYPFLLGACLFVWNYSIRVSERGAEVKCSFGLSHFKGLTLFRRFQLDRFVAWDEIDTVEELRWGWGKPIIIFQDTNRNTPVGFALTGLLTGYKNILAHIIDQLDSAIVPASVYERAHQYKAEREQSSRAA